MPARMGYQSIDRDASTQWRVVGLVAAVAAVALTAGVTLGSQPAATSLFSPATIASRPITLSAAAPVNQMSNPMVRTQEFYASSSRPQASVGMLFYTGVYCILGYIDAAPLLVHRLSSRVLLVGRLVLATAVRCHQGQLGSVCPHSIAGQTQVTNILTWSPTYLVTYHLVPICHKGRILSVP